MATNGTTIQIGHTQIIAWLQSIVDALFARPADKTAESAEQSEFATARTAELFTQALHENSNLELDWLWYAANMTGATERRYCLNRALAINPDSSLARSALAKLPKTADSSCEAVMLRRATGSNDLA